MDTKKVPVFIGTVAVIAGLLIAYYARISTAQQTGRETNAEAVKAGSLAPAANKDSTKQHSSQ